MTIHGDFGIVAAMNDTEKQIAKMLLTDVTLVNAADRLRDYHALLECAEKRQRIEASDEGKPTGIAAIDQA